MQRKQQKTGSNQNINTTIFIQNNTHSTAKTGGYYCKQTQIIVFALQIFWLKINSEPKIVKFVNVYLCCSKTVMMTTPLYLGHYNQTQPKNKMSVFFSADIGTFDNLYRSHFISK